MTSGRTLSSYFDGAAAKTVSAVEAHPSRSNQHEFNGVAGLLGLLGDPGSEKRVLPTRYVYLDDDMNPVVADATATWYDARAAHPTRTEYRLYYPANEVVDAMAAGDFIVIAKATGELEHDLLVVVCPGSSTVAAQLQNLFDVEAGERLDIQTDAGDTQLGITERILLEALGVDVAFYADGWLDEMLSRFGAAFPGTKVFSAFARSTAPEVDGTAHPDEALLAWMEREEALFRSLERHLLVERFAGAAGDVDEILRVSMQAFQRRKSRAGHALENHVAHVFDLHGVAYQQQAMTEGRKKPDFLFPDAMSYQDPGFPSESLRMLGVKTTCKDRWRQVLTEADRIPEKHLLTLEAPISAAQLAEMGERSLTLVIPAPLHEVMWPLPSNVIALAELLRVVGP